MITTEFVCIVVVRKQKFIHLFSFHKSHSRAMLESIKNQSNQDILTTVQNKVMLKEHTPENLFSLLVSCNPELKLEEVFDDSKRMQAMKNLMITIHPSNFPYNEDALYIFEDVQHFYDLSNQKISESKVQLNKRRRRKGSVSPTSVVELVVQFNIRQKWEFLNQYTRPQPPKKLTSGKVLAPLIAYQCINARGAIAHGKRPSLIYSWDNAYTCVGLSVQEVLDKHGGFKTISGGKIDEIKVELIHRGPVISFSFIPSRQLAEKYPNSILQSRIEKHQYCLIIGWKLTEFGEVWLVQSYHGKEIMHIPVGQFNVEETIIYPKDNFKNVTWQQGPYFDRDMSSSDRWFKSSEIGFLLNSSELEELMTLFDKKGIHQAITEKCRFVIRDTKCAAHSRSCRLQEISFDQSIKKWKIVCAFNDNGINPFIKGVK